jgi:hypothetical protein
VTFITALEEGADGVLNIEVFALRDGQRETVALLACVLDNPEALRELLRAAKGALMPFGDETSLQGSAS